MINWLRSIFKRSRRLDRLYYLSDFLALLCSYYLAHTLRFSKHFGPMVFGFVSSVFGWGDVADLSGTGYESGYITHSWRYILMISAALYFFYAMQGLYEEHRFLKRRSALWRVTVSNAAVWVLIIIFFFFHRNYWHPRSFFVTVFLLNTVFMLAFRMFVREGLAWLGRHKGVGLMPVVLVGETQESQIIEEIIEGHHPHGYRIAGKIASPQNGELDELSQLVKSSQAGLVILADDQISVARTMQILDLTARHDAAVKVLTTQLSVLHLRAGESFDTIRGRPLVHFEEPSASSKDTWLRRNISRALAALAMLVLSPFLLLVALAIKMSDGGPVLFVQQRYGVDKRPFLMYKFRTMRVEAESMLPELEEQNEAGTGLFKLRRDPRVTLLGRFLRRFSIDELPQILNIIKGDMRIVGPRPLPYRDLCNYYEDWHYHRHNGRPGLTCLWQVSGRSEIDFANMCILDVYYLRNHSWPLDLRIVLRTFGVVLFGRGAY